MMWLQLILLTSFALYSHAEMKVPAPVSVKNFGCPQEFATFGCCPYYYTCLDDTPYVESCNEDFVADVETRDCMQRQHVAACSPNFTADAFTDYKELTCDLLKQMNKTQEEERRKVINDVSPIPGRPYEVNCSSNGTFPIGCTRFYYLCMYYTPLILRCGHGRTYNTDIQWCGPRRDIDVCRDIAEGTGEEGLAVTEIEDEDDWDEWAELHEDQDETNMPTPCEAPTELNDFCGDKPSGLYPLKPCCSSFVICQPGLNFTTLFTCMNGLKYDEKTKLCSKHGTLEACKDVPEDADEVSRMPRCPDA